MRHILFIFALVLLTSVQTSSTAHAAKLKLELPEIQIKVVDKLGTPVPDAQVIYGGHYKQGKFVLTTLSPGALIPTLKWEKVKQSLDKIAPPGKWPVFGFAVVTDQNGRATIPAYKGEIRGLFVEEPVFLVHLAGNLTGFETETGKHYSLLSQIPINTKVARVNGKIAPDGDYFVGLTNEHVRGQGKPITLEFELLDATAEEIADRAALLTLHAKTAISNGGDCESWLSTPSEKGAALVPFVPDAKLPNRGE